jgi:hypothetical protein
MSNGAWNIFQVSPKVAAGTLAGALVTTMSCVLADNHISVAPGVMAAAATIAAALAGWLAPNHSTTPPPAS